MSNQGIIGFKRTDHINICVTPDQLEAARSFYSDVIGLAPVERPEVFGAPGYWFRIADVELHIGVEPAKPRSVQHSAFEVDDLDAAKKHLEQMGVEIVVEPVIPGRSRFAFYDPFGNRIELLQWD